MSKESAVDFMEKASTDDILQRRIAALGPNDTAALVELAASAGYSLSVEDLKEASSGGREEGELGDGSLEAVAGGLNPQPLPPRYLQSFLRLNPALLRGIIIVGGH